MAIVAVSLFAFSFSFLSQSTLEHHATVTEAYAQTYVETVRHRDPTVDLGRFVEPLSRQCFHRFSYVSLMFLCFHSALKMSSNLRAARNSEDKSIFFIDENAIHNDKYCKSRYQIFS